MADYFKIGKDYFMNLIIDQDALKHRLLWIDKIIKIQGKFTDDSIRIEKEIENEIKQDGEKSLLNHLRLCSSIPESYEHDSSEEKLYSKYTDAVIAAAFKQIGFQSLILSARADAADVEVIGKDYSFVADAKAFRLSRTAKNQKDFKIQSMATWKRGKPYAMVVSPLYQLPTKSSQIYQQSAVNSVCIFSYAHLCVLLRFSNLKGTSQANKLLLDIFKSIETMNGSKDAVFYWKTINSSILEFDSSLSDIWKEEKTATFEAIEISKKISLEYLANERQRILQLSHAEALKQLIEMHKIDLKSQIIQKVSNNDIMSF
jgi:hypothetical protein